MNSTVDPPVSCPLTLLFGARNDAYMGDFKFRFSTCLNFLAQNLKAIDRIKDVEVLVVDWNSDVPLHTVLPLSNDARELVRFIVVPPNIAGPAQKDSPLPIPIVQNVAIRRARGKFIGQTDSDILFSRPSLRALFDVIDGNVTEIPTQNSLMVASRRHMPFQQILRKPSLAEVDAYLARNAAVFPKEDFFPGFATPSALAMLHRDQWYACRGYDERLIYWGWMEIDLYLRLTQRMPWFDLAGVGVNLIHIEHYTSDRTASKNPRKMNPTPTSLHYEANGGEWGLANHDLAIFSAAELPPPSWETSFPSDDAASLHAAINGMANLQFVQQFAQTTRLVGEQANVLLPLAWYGRERFPRTYIDIGARYPATAALVASASPGLEIYGIDTWQDTPAGAAPPIWTASNAIAQFGRRQNYTRFLSGDPATALQRLFGSPSAPVAIDLALLRTDPMYGDVAQNAHALSSHLSAGGAIVVSTRVAAEFDQAWRALTRSYPHWPALRLNANPGETQNGIILKRP